MNSKTGYWESDTDAGHSVDPPLSLILVKGLSKITSAVDFGCGTGYYAEQLNRAGIVCDAYDGNPNTPKLTGGLGKVLDLSEKMDLGKKYDAVLCLEVGEHIPAEFEQVFLDNICNHADKILILSWATPEQPGTGHVNCRPHSYIIDQVTQRGFTYHKEWSDYIRSYASLSWLKNNLLMFKK